MEKRSSASSRLAVLVGAVPHVLRVADRAEVLEAAVVHAAVIPGWTGLDAREQLRAVLVGEALVDLRLAGREHAFLTGRERRRAGAVRAVGRPAVAQQRRLRDAILVLAEAVLIAIRIARAVLRALH